MNLKASPNLAYKIVNYAFDSEISQTAGLEKTNPHREWGRSEKSTLGPSKRMFTLGLFAVIALTLQSSHLHRHTPQRFPGF